MYGVMQSPRAVCVAPGRSLLSLSSRPWFRFVSAIRQSALSGKPETSAAHADLRLFTFQCGGNVK